MWWKYSDRDEQRTETKRRSMASRCGGNARPDRGERQRLTEGTQGGRRGAQRKRRAGQRSRKNVETGEGQEGVRGNAKLRNTIKWIIQRSDTHTSTWLRQFPMNLERCEKILCNNLKNLQISPGNGFTNILIN